MYVTNYMHEYVFLQDRNDDVTCTTPPPTTMEDPEEPTEGDPDAASKPIALHLVILCALLFMLIM